MKFFSSLFKIKTERISTLFQFSTIFRGCYHAQSKITIPSMNLSDGNKSGGSNWLSYMNLDFKNFGSADVVFWIVFLAICYCLMHCIRDFCPNCLARGSRVHADNIGSQDETVNTEEQIQAEIKIEEPSQQPGAEDLV